MLGAARNTEAAEIDVSLLTTAEARDHPRAGETTGLISHGWVRIVTPFAHAGDETEPGSELTAAAEYRPLQFQTGVSLLTRAESRVHPRTRETTRLISHGWVRIVTPLARKSVVEGNSAHLNARRGT